tara:strand:+ start:427 stop:732 length:306 start_codon:yes stop_codon:yes gene_type:complete
MRDLKPEDCIKNLKQALKTFEERGKSYGDSYNQVGKVMAVLFPNGVELKTEADFNRMGLLNMIVSKLTRYANQWEKTHKDSAHDMGVYSFILEAFDDCFRS